MLVVHVGLGKTATTTLQRDVFPKLSAIRPDIGLYDRRLARLCRKHHLFQITDAERQEISERISGRNFLISLETLVNWNPRFWEHAADRNLELFGRDAVIVLTVRDPVDYLTSVYQQKVHDGNVVDPHRFFVDGGTYDAIAGQVPSSRLDYFDVDAFDLERLHAIYAARFPSVYMVPIEKIRDFRFLGAPFDLAPEEIAALQAAFATAVRRNRGYSDLAMRLTFARERLLNGLGARSIGADDRGALEIYNALNRSTPGEAPRSFGESSRTGGMLRRLRWKNLMQSGVDMYLPYRKYRLPPTVYLNPALVEKNRAFLGRLRQADGRP